MCAGTPGSCCPAGCGCSNCRWPTSPSRTAGLRPRNLCRIWSCRSRSTSRWQSSACSGSAQPELRITDIRARYQHDGIQHVLRVDSARFAQGRYQGDASLLARAPLTLTLDVNGKFEVPLGPRKIPLDARVTVRGPLARGTEPLHIVADLQPGTTGAGPAAAAQAMRDPCHGAHPAVGPPTRGRCPGTLQPARPVGLVARCPPDPPDRGRAGATPRPAMAGPCQPGQHAARPVGQGPVARHPGTRDRGLRTRRLDHRVPAGAGCWRQPRPARAAGRQQHGHLAGPGAVGGHQPGPTAQPVRTRTAGRHGAGRGERADRRVHRVGGAHRQSAGGVATGRACACSAPAPRAAGSTAGSV